MIKLLLIYNIIFCLILYTNINKLKMEIYCVKCRNFTPNKPGSEYKAVSKNDKLCVKALCSVCNSKKNMFIPNDSSKKIKVKGGNSSLVSKFIDNLPFEAHLFDFEGGPNHNKFQKYSFAGPATRLDKRLVLDENNNIQKIITPPVNKLDECAMYHDIAYISKNQEDRLKADKVLLDCSENFHPKSRFEKINKAIVQNVMKAKLATGQGNQPTDFLEYYDYSNKKPKRGGDLNNQVGI